MANRRFRTSLNTLALIKAGNHVHHLNAVEMHCEMFNRPPHTMNGHTSGDGQVPKSLLMPEVPATLFKRFLVI